jgi:hypothetical protein
LTREDLSNVARFEEFVNDLLEPGGRKLRARAVEKLKEALKSPPLSDAELARQLEQLAPRREPERAYGAVLKAVVAVLAKRPDGMRLCEIRRGVGRVVRLPHAQIVDPRLFCETT